MSETTLKRENDENAQNVGSDNVPAADDGKLGDGVVSKAKKPKLEDPPKPDTKERKTREKKEKKPKAPVKSRASVSVGGRWSPQEDIRLLTGTVKVKEAIDWTELLATLPGRSAAACKQRLPILLPALWGRDDKKKST